MQGFFSLLIEVGVLLVLRGEQGFFFVYVMKLRISLWNIRGAND